METENLSTQWNELMQKEKEFRKAVGNYNRNVDLETKVKDIQLAFKDNFKTLIITRLMSEGYIQNDVIERVWRELVYFAFHGNVSVASWSVETLSKMSFQTHKLYQEEMLDLIFTYAEKEKEKEKEDNIALLFGLQLLEKTRNEEAVKKYISLYKETLELENEDI